MKVNQQDITMRYSFSIIEEKNLKNRWQTRHTLNRLKTKWEIFLVYSCRVWNNQSCK